VKSVLLDTGPLVALLDRSDKHHAWAREVLATVQSPMRTCEAVLSEACFLLRRVEGAADAVFDLVVRKVVSVTPRTVDGRAPWPFHQHPALTQAGLVPADWLAT
jgi:predicted nucleic acid-binding protein